MDRATAFNIIFGVLAVTLAALAALIAWLQLRRMPPRGQDEEAHEMQ